jgi:RNA polymerase sigma factor (sigma-70 family)
MYEHEGGRNPVLGAPGSNNYSGLIASSTTETSREHGTKFQQLTEKEANALCEKHIKHAYNIAGRYEGKGIARKELRAASLLGLVEASRNFNPKLGIPFWGFAQHRTEGAIKDLFRPSKYAPDYQRKDSLNAPAVNGKTNEETETERGDLVIDESEPTLAFDLSELTPKERTVVEARLDDQTLRSVGNGLGLSAERVRQIGVAAHTKLRQRENNDPVKVAPGDRDARQFCNEFKSCRGNFSKLRSRRGYQKPSRLGWAKAVEDARFAERGPVRQIKITKHLSGEEKRSWVQRLRNAEATDWGRHDGERK